MSNDSIVIIFSGYNNRAVISFIRTLEANNIDYVVVAKSNDDLIFKTIYKNNIVLTRSDSLLDLDLIEKCIDAINAKHKVTKYFVAPSTESLNRFMLRERKKLENINIVVPLASEEIYTCVSDKKIFSDICLESGISVPDEYSSIEETIFPFVAKPKTYVSQGGLIHTPFLIFSSKQKESYLSHCNPDDFYFQKYVEGRSVYLLYYFSKDGEVYKFSQENLAQQAGGKSMVFAVSSGFHKTPVSGIYEGLFNKLNFSGLVMVELKVTPELDYMIEANPRFWGPSQLFIDAGMNLFEVLLYDYGFIENKPNFSEHKNRKYLWTGGIEGALKKSKKLSFMGSYANKGVEDITAWVEYDIYNRADTLKVFEDCL